MQFNVHALDTQQQVVALSLEAASEAAARDIAQSRGLSVFSVEGKRQAFALPRLTRSGGFKPALFSIELLALLEAGSTWSRRCRRSPRRKRPASVDRS